MIILTTAPGHPSAGYAVVLPVSARVSDVALHASVCKALGYGPHRLELVGDEVRFTHDGSTYALITESDVVPALLKGSHPKTRERAEAIAAADAEARARS